MLYENVNYTSDISYLNNCFIYEYDMSKANISVLYEEQVIDSDTYNYLYNTERMVRQVYVGKLIKENPTIYDVIKNGIIKAKKLLFEANNIQDYEVLSIKNDAVFIINRQLNTTEFGLLQFKCKNIYTGFYKVKNLEFFYYYNTVNKDERIDVKGINDNTLLLHENYMLQVFKDIFYSVQTSGVSTAISLIKNFYINYIRYNIDVGYYRMFDNNSKFHYKPAAFINTGFSADSVNEKDKMSLDITYNISLLMELQKILASMYFK